MLTPALRRHGATTHLAVVLAVIATSALLNAQEPPVEVGFVLKVKGEWLLDGKTLAAGERLPSGGKIYHSEQKGAESASFDYITVIFLDGKLESRSWNKTESESAPIQLPRAANELPSRWNQIVTAVMGAFPGHPERFAQMSRARKWHGRSRCSR